MIRFPFSCVYIKHIISNKLLGQQPPEASRVSNSFGKVSQIIRLKISDIIFSSGDTYTGKECQLRLVKGTEKDFNVDDNRFAFLPGQLNKLLNPLMFTRNLRG